MLKHKANCHKQYNRVARSFEIYKVHENFKHMAQKLKHKTKKQLSKWYKRAAG